MLERVVCLARVSKANAAPERYGEHLMDRSIVVRLRSTRSFSIAMVSSFGPWTM